MDPKDYQHLGLYMRDQGISSLKMDYHQKKINSMTPYILEERQLNVTQMDVFSRLLMERIIWVAGEVNENMAIVTQAQLMFLDSIGNTDITMHISSPGGSVSAGLSMVDVMDYIKSDIRTINTGIAASMGSVLLGAGTKGKRGSLKNSRTMLHQSSGGFRGNIQDAEIDMVEWKKINDTLFELLGKYCNKSSGKVMKDASRDLWLSAEECKSYGLIDEIVGNKK